MTSDLAVVSQILECKAKKKKKKECKARDFCGGPWAKTPRSQYMGPGFDP